MNIKRGEIYYIASSRYHPTYGSVQEPNRPAIIVSNDANNQHSETVEVVYLTTAPKKKLPTHCLICSAKRASIALCEQVTTISTEQIRDCMGVLTEAEMKDVDSCIAISLGLELENPVEVKTVTVEVQTQEAEQLRKELDKAKRQAALFKDMCDYLMDKLAELA